MHAEFRADFRDVHEGYGAAVVQDQPNQPFTFVSQDPGMFFGTPDPCDHFGGALAAGDFNGDGVSDLAIGAPGATWLAQPQTGFVQVLYGFSESVFADGFESGDTSVWSSTL